MNRALYLPYIYILLTQIFYFYLNIVQFIRLFINYHYDIDHDYDIDHEYDYFINYDIDHDYDIIINYDIDHDYIFNAAKTYI